MVKRNHSYSVGDIEYTANDYILKCKTAGITASTPLVISGGGAIIDGIVEWELIKDGDMPSDVYETYTVTVGSGWQTETLGYAPADGYLVVLFISSDIATQQIGVQTRDILDINYNHSHHTKGGGNTYLTANSHIKSGEPISIGYLYAQSVTVYFYYSVNSAKELGLI